MAAISNQTVFANTLLSLTASATDTDLPPQTLTFTLGSGAPTGATITTNGLFTWTPTHAQSPSSNHIVVIVTDNGTPPLSATQSFTVTVLPREAEPPGALTAVPVPVMLVVPALSKLATAVRPTR